MNEMQKRSRVKKKAALQHVGVIPASRLYEMARQAQYKPSPYHKPRSSGPNFDLMPRPRPDKTLCDTLAVKGPTDASCLLRAGFRRGMISVQEYGGWPQNVWAVDAEGVVYEGQLSNRGNGEYHGYPMKNDEHFVLHIQKEWDNRA